MTEISRRQLFAMGAAAAVAPVLPAVLPAPVGTTLNMAISNGRGIDALMSRIVDGQVQSLVRQIEGEIMLGDHITIEGDPRTFYVTGVSNG